MSNRLSSLFCLALLFAGGAARAEDAVREILVPADRLPLLLSDDGDHVMMSEVEYRKLLAETRRAATSLPPEALVRKHASYRIDVGPERAIVRATYQVESLVDELQSVQLSFHGVGILNATLDGAPAPFAYLRGDSGSRACHTFVRGRGDHTLELEGVSRMSNTATLQKFIDALPVFPVTELTITVPGNVELREGGPAIERAYEPEKDRTRFRLMPHSSIDVSFSINNLPDRQDRMVVARSVQVAEVMPETERLDAKISCDVLHSPVDTFRFRVPAGFEVEGVNAPNLATWEFPPPRRPGTPRTLTVQLREKTTDTVVVDVSALRTGADPAAWSFPTIKALDVAAASVVAGVRAHEQLRMIDVESKTAVTLDTDIVANAMPASQLRRSQAGVGERRKTVLVRYSPTQDFSLSAKFEPVPEVLCVRERLQLAISERKLELTGAAVLLPRGGRRATVDLILPKGWTLTGLSRSSGAPLSFERYDHEGDDARVRVTFSPLLTPGVAQRIRFNAESIPDGWLGDWSERPFDFPRIRVPDATEHAGAIAVRSEADLDVTPSETTGLEPLNRAERAKRGLDGGQATDMAYAFRHTDYAATLKVRRRTPRVSAESIAIFRVETDRLVCRTELLYDIRRAGTRELTFDLPAATPDALAVSAVAGDIKEYTPAEPKDGWRHWTVHLARKRRGRVHLLVDFDYPFPADERREITLPLPRAVGVEYQAGLLAVEGHPELDVRVAEAPRPVDVGELVKARRQPGPRLLGAYAFAGPPPEVAVTVTRPSLAEVPGAVMQQARLVTALGVEGRSQTSATYRVRSKTDTITVELPEAAILWSVTVDGTPANPRGEGRYITLDMPDDPGTKPHSVHVVYEAPQREFGLLAETCLVAPCLLLGTDEAGVPVSVPTVDAMWSVHPPRGYRIVRGGGGLSSPSLTPPKLAVVELPGVLMRLGGGADFQRGLIASMVGHPFRSFVLALLIAIGIWGFIFLRRKAHEGLKAFIVGVVQLGGVALLVLVFVGMLLPALSGARQKARHVAAQYDSERKSETVQLGLVDVSDSVRENDLMESVDRGVKPESPLDSQVQVAQKPAQQLEAQVWAVKGARSLRIDVDTTTAGVVFRGTGGEPRIRALLWPAGRMAKLALALGFSLVVAGSALTYQPRRVKATYVLCVFAASLLLPAVPGLAFAVPLLNAAFYAGCALVVFYLLAPLIQVICPALRKPAAASVTSRAAACLVLATALFASPSPAVANSATSDGDNLPPVQLPGDVVVRPYTPGEGVDAAPKPDGRVLVPRTQFEKLERAGQPDVEAPSPPAAIAVTGALLEGTLADESPLILRGTVELQSFVDHPEEFRLWTAGAVLAKATLNGQPASVRTTDERVDTRQEALKAHPKLAKEHARKHAINHDVAYEHRVVSSVVVPKKGTHRLEFELHLPLKRHGGWRTAAAELPNLPLGTIHLTIPTAQTEVRLESHHERRELVTDSANQILKTVVPNRYPLELRWRPKVARSERDRTLTAMSAATFDLREDAFRLAWKLGLAFQHGEREAFTVLVPEAYHIDRVVGDSVRKWERGKGQDTNRVTVTLKSPAERDTAFTVYAWAPVSLVEENDSRALAVPGIDVPDATRHTGRILLRASPHLAVRTTETRRVSRIDTDGVDTPDPGGDSPLGVRPYQAYEFYQPPFAIDLAATVRATRFDTAMQTILRIAERERRLECNAVVTADDRPLHRVRIRIPDGFEPDSVRTRTASDWVIEVMDGTRVLTVYFPHGITGEHSILFEGRLGEPGAVEGVSLPPLSVVGATRQAGQVAVLADPAFNVRAESLTGIEPVLLERVNSWLTRNQRPHVRLAFEYKGETYGGQLQIIPRRPRVQAWSLSTVRVTDQAVAETILATFGIANAGLDRIRLRLPARFADADIRVPLLRERTDTPTEDGQALDVELALQHKVMGQLRVLIELDRGLDDGERRIVPPTLLTGSTTRQFLAVESDSRDEIVVEAGDGLEKLTRQRTEWRQVSELLGDSARHVYLAQPGAETPELRFSVKQRQTVSTAGARIGLARAVLFVDANGDYRGRQNYRVDNQTEQVLEVALPTGADLWSARVAGTLVKPMRGTGDGADTARIPLVKTAEGELDYEVVLKYGGTLASLGGMSLADFPLMHTKNVPVEQSQVELRLPRDRRWLAFDGTMRRVEDEATLKAGFLAYQTKQAERLLQTLEFGSVYSRARAYSNVAKLEKSMRKTQKAGREDAGSNIFQKTLDRSEMILQEAEETRRKVRNETMDAVQQTDAPRLEQAFDNQTNDYTLNQVLRGDGNWHEPTRKHEAPKAPRQTFNAAWITENALEQGDPANWATQQRLDSTVAPNLEETQREVNGGGAHGALGGFGRPGKPMPGGEADGGDISFADEDEAGDFEAAGDLGFGYDKAKGRKRNEGEMARDQTDQASRGGQRAAVAKYYRQQMVQSETKESERQLDEDMTGLQDQRRQLGDSPEEETPEEATGEVARQTGGLASLDFTLPTFDASRWQKVHFTTPRGEQEIRARSVSRERIATLKRLGVAVAAVLVLLGAYALVVRTSARIDGPRLAKALAIVGILGVLFGILPNYAVLAIVVGLLGTAALGLRETLQKARA